MLYLLPSELDIFARQVITQDALSTELGRQAMIQQASSGVDSATGRSEFGLEVRNVIDEQVNLSLALSGYLSNTPFIEWIGSSATLFYFGYPVSVGTLLLSDFSVEKKSGVIRNLTRVNLQVGGESGLRFRGTSPTFRPTSPYGVAGQAEEAASPYLMTVSYKAGYFAEALIDSSGGVNATEIIVNDVTNLMVGHEFYFSADPVNEPTVDHRFITAINTSTRAVSFTPAVKYALDDTMTLRQIDKAVRSATADIISDLLTFPPNTRDFSKSFGRGDLSKRWVRMNDQFIPMIAAAKLNRYVR